nr:uncharacterized protein LOC109189624 isoform X2 [Ipomoea trifida]
MCHLNRVKQVFSLLLFFVEKYLFFVPVIVRIKCENDPRLVGPKVEISGLEDLGFSQSHSRFFQMKYMKPLNLFQELVKSQGRLLGLDVGNKYVGLAVSDVQNRLASPLSVLIRKKSNIDLMATDFQSLISELSLKGFIFGYPFDRQRNNPDAVQVKLLIDDLCETGKLVDLKYTFWDESFSSKSVEMLLKPLNLHPVQSKTIVDKFAAVEILQGYLDYVNRNEKMKLSATTHK